MTRPLRVAKYYQVNIYELKSVNRSPNNRKPRTIAIYLSCLLSNQKSQIIADSFTNTSTQGVSKAFCRLKQEIESDIALQKEINYLSNAYPLSLSVPDPVVVSGTTERASLLEPNFF